MLVNIILLSFLAFYVIAVYLDTVKRSPKWSFYGLILACVVLAFIAGSRSLDWADTEVYYFGFADHTKTLSNFSINDKPWGYDEYGFYFLGVVIKTFLDNPRVYLLVMSALSLWLLYKYDRKYCAYPLIALSIYVARFFMNRNMIQMRSAIAIPMILWAMYLAKEKRLLSYMAVVAVTYTIHHMALLAIPFYFFNFIRIRKWHIVVGLIAAFIFAATASGSIAGIAEKYSDDLQYQTYVTVDYVSEKGLMNPMIYFQVLILLAFTFGESKLKPLTSYYRLLRTGYFYSTLILIVFSQYSALSGRTSTVYATLEMIILPIIGQGLFKKKALRILYYSALGVVLGYFLYSKYMDNYALQMQAY